MCRLTDSSLVDCAVSAEERWSLGMVDVERGAWWLVTSQQQNYFNTKSTDYTILYDTCGDNCRVDVV